RDYCSDGEYRWSRHDHRTNGGGGEPDRGGGCCPVSGQTGWQEPDRVCCPHRIMTSQGRRGHCNRQPRDAARDRVTPMDDVYQRIATLLLAKRALLEAYLLQRRGAHTPEATIPRRATSAPCMLSFAQQRLWFLAQLEYNTDLFESATIARMAGHFQT